MKLSEGTPQQQSGMMAYRAYAKKKFSEDHPSCETFANAVEQMETTFRKHWSIQDARAFMIRLVDMSWDFYNPYGFLREWSKKAEEAMAKGMPFDEIEASGFFESEGSLIPIDNLTPEQNRRHELIGFDEHQKAKAGMSFKDRIKAMQKGARFGNRNDN